MNRCGLVYAERAYVFGIATVVQSIPRFFRLRCCLSVQSEYRVKSLTQRISAFIGVYRYHQRKQSFTVFQQFFCFSEMIDIIQYIPKNAFWLFYISSDSSLV